MLNPSTRYAVSQDKLCNFMIIIWNIVISSEILLALKGVSSPTYYFQYLLRAHRIQANCKHCRIKSLTWALKMILVNRLDLITSFTSATYPTSFWSRFEKINKLMSHKQGHIQGSIRVSRQRLLSLPPPAPLSSMLNLPYGIVPKNAK